MPTISIAAAQPETDITTAEADITTARMGTLDGASGGGMAYEYRTGMKMYEAIWERDGKCVGVCCMHAASEADVLSEAQAFFAEHPECDLPGGHDGTTVRVGIVGGDGSIFSPDVLQAPKPES